MKKKRYSRQLIAKLTAKEIRSCQFYAESGRRLNAAKVEIDFYRQDSVVAKVTFYDDPAHKQTIVRWYNKSFYALRYGAREAKPICMTLAMWRTFNNR